MMPTRPNNGMRNGVPPRSPERTPDRSRAGTPDSLPPRPQAPTPDSAMHHPYLPYRPEYARSLSGQETPASMSYSRLEGTESTDHLLPKQGRSRKASASSAGPMESSSGDISLQNLTPKGKARRKERPVDPILQALTKPGPQRERAVPATGLEDIDLNSAPNSRRPSTDDMGLPLPGQSGPTFPDAIREEEKAIQGKNKKAAIAAAVALAAITVTGATVSTLKTTGKL